MQIILVRHAIALDKAIAKSKKIKDADRKLTSSGKKKFKNHVLNHIPIFKKSEFILSSNYVRAEETAKILLKTLPFEIKIVSNSLPVPHGSVEKFISYLKTQSYRNFIVVSHEPFLSNLIEALTKIPTDSLHLKKGCFVVLRLQQTNSYKLYQVINP